MLTSCPTQQEKYLRRYSTGIFSAVETLEIDSAIAVKYLEMQLIGFDRLLFNGLFTDNVIFFFILIMFLILLQN